MTSNEAKILRYVELKGVAVSGSQLERQFGLSAGALIVPINTLKRNLCIEQDGPWYRLTTIGQDALSRPERSARKPFADRQGW